MDGGALITAYPKPTLELRHESKVDFTFVRHERTAIFPLDPGLVARIARTRPYVHVLFGARQTGKSTLLNQLMPEPALRLNFADPLDRAPYLANPGRFLADCRALPAHRGPHLVLVDEAQAVPEIFNAVQTLYDSHKRRWRFVLCGSSARKLRQTGANLLPGRSFLHRLFRAALEKICFRRRAFTSSTWVSATAPPA